MVLYPPQCHSARLKGYPEIGIWPPAYNAQSCSYVYKNVSLQQCLKQEHKVERLRLLSAMDLVAHECLKGYSQEILVHHDM